MIPGLDHDPDLVADITARFDLRKPVAEAFEATITALATEGEYDPATPLVLDLATGAGKTYVIVAVIEYLRAQRVRNVLVVTPGRIVQAKTVANLTEGDPKYIPGALVAPTVITPADYDLWRPTNPSDVSNDQPMQVFVLTVHQLLAPTGDDPATRTTGSTRASQQKAMRTFRESSGHLHDYLSQLDDLLILADEHHLYSETAQAFNAGIRELAPAAVVGLTASAAPTDQILYRYPLRQAILDKHVKMPVIAFRRNGYGEHAEEQQLRDAVALLEVKQARFERHQQSDPSAPKITPALFVQCTDIAHATEVATLLRSSEFFGSHHAVLQVDNQHDDATTLAALNAMDSPGSQVRAVVSVNKLKEGWDVKNIAVMVTLRPMTSEILTQQTMGRGLRLPFGHWVDDQHINQLDVIAHDSFRSLLSTEDVLRSFGLEQLVQQQTGSAPAPGGTQDPPAGGDSGGVTGQGSTGLAGQGEGHRVAPPSDDDSTRVELVGDGTVAVVEVDDNAQVGHQAVPEQQVVRVNAQFSQTTFTFPSTSMTQAETPFQLHMVTDPDIEASARGVTEQTSTLHRESLIVGRRRITTREEEDVSVSALAADTAAVKDTLVSTAMQMRCVPPTETNRIQLTQRIVPTLMQAAPVTQWSEKSMSSAAAVLRRLVEDTARKHADGLSAQVLVHPVRLPIHSEVVLPVGMSLHERLVSESHRAGFRPQQYYGTWEKGLFDHAKFDSFSAEYRIAALLNRSTSVVWWTRLYRSDGARIAYTVRRDYYPDFVAFDRDGYHWIIEGKSEKGRDDEDVQRKKDAAEDVVRLLIGDPVFAAQKWGYCIAYESDVAAADTWEDLRDGAAPVKTFTGAT